MRTPVVVTILVVAGLLGMLVAAIRPTAFCILDDSPIAKAQSDIGAIESALKFYRLDNFRYPTTEQGLIALVKRPGGPDIENWAPRGYIVRLPRDPWGHEYRYESPGRYGEIDIYTPGKDGRVGGVGLDATIGNWKQQD